MRMLTSIGAMPHNALAVSALAAGFSSSRTGVQSPLIKTVVFLCQKISTAFMSSESFYYGVVIFWGVLGLAAPVRGTANLKLNHAARYLAVIGGDYSILRTGSPL